MYTEYASTSFSQWFAPSQDPPWLLFGAIEKNSAPVPTVSEWALVALALLLVTAGTVVFRHRPSSNASTRSDTSDDRSAGRQSSRRAMIYG
ncbi:MAG: IPTL-CTERM sorting domain-containing protein [Planctomycetota bacterium]|jgi:hypothetical protein